MGSSAWSLEYRCGDRTGNDGAADAMESSARVLQENFAGTAFLFRLFHAERLGA